MPIVGTIVTTTSLQEIPLKNNSDKSELGLVFCNTATVDNYIFLSLHNNEDIIPLYFNYPVLAYDTYPRDNTPFKITLGVNDRIFVRSTTPGIVVSLIK